jgi:hypothetical protein
MKKILCSILFVLVIVVSANSQSKSYFVSPLGDDNNSGLSVKAAWKTIERVNRNIFQPGDVVLFQSGGIWNGQLHPQGSGVAGKPIVIKSYGNEVRPVINLGAAEGAAIQLVNQSWWEIRNIEVTSSAQPMPGIGRQGIVAWVRGEGQHVQHIVISDCYIHDIWGQLGGNNEYSGYNSCAILVKIDRNRTRTSTLNDILIENNRIERFDKCGIIVSGGRNDVIVRKNVMDNLGGDGIFVSGCYKGLIEYNVATRTCMRSGDANLPGGKTWWPHTAAMWIARCDQTLMQYNEVYDTGRQPGNGDGEAYDFDFDCKNCVLQYNYSKNNHGFLLIMYRTFGNIARYNISENDQSHLMQLQCDINERNLIYNNVFYVDYGTIDIDYFCGDDGKKEMSTIGANLRNNIFYATGQGRFRSVYTKGNVLLRQFNDSVKLPHPSLGTLFYHNCYFGPWLKGLPDDPEKLVADPMFVAPGTGGIGLSTLAGYKLKAESPCINTGMLIAMNGTRDFYGNPVNDGATDYGAYEQIGSGAFSDTLIEKELNRVESAKSCLAWAKKTFPLKIEWSPENNKIIVSLAEPLEKSVTGTLILDVQNLNIRPATIDLNKPERNDFTFTVKTGKNLVLPSLLHVKLADEEFREEWDIPVSSVQKK